MTISLPPTDRRGLLRGAAVATLALPVLAACDATEVTPRSGSVKQSGDSSAADAALVAKIAGQVAGTRAAAQKLAKHDHAHRTWALQLASLHQQHLARLGTGWIAPGVVAGTPKSLIAAEERLQQSLVRATGQVESGALAQVLASMAAAIGQRLVVA
ncbi:hypothetical protein [Nocardioides montaniterrae]